MGSICKAAGGLVFDIEKRANVRYKAKQIRDVGARVFNCVDNAWLHLIDDEELMQDDEMEFLLCLGDEYTPIGKTKTKCIYNILVQKVVMKPASEKRWKELFPDKQIGTIWLNVDVPYLPHALFQAEFKLRHRRICIRSTKRFVKGLVLCVKGKTKIWSIYL